MSGGAVVTGAPRAARYAAHLVATQTCLNRRTRTPVTPLSPAESMRRCAMESPNRQNELERAYVQSRVIETGLQRLAASLSSVDGALRDDLCEYAQQFDRYIRRLRDARAS